MVFLIQMKKINTIKTKKTKKQTKISTEEMI
jgi:hypothetical protein